VTGERFRAGLRAYPEFALLLLRCTVGRVREADRARTEFGAYPAEERVVLLLDRMADEHGQPVPGETDTVCVQISHQEIAGAVGASRHSVMRALRSLQVQGILNTRRERIVITDLQALATRAAQYRS
jgi:CRP-like cAMP-binding protein